LSQYYLESLFLTSIDSKVLKFSSKTELKEFASDKVTSLQSSTSLSIPPTGKKSFVLLMPSDFKPSINDGEKINVNNEHNSFVHKKVNH